VLPKRPTRAGWGDAAEAQPEPALYTAEAAVEWTAGAAAPAAVSAEWSGDAAAAGSWDAPAATTGSGWD